MNSKRENNKIRQQDVSTHKKQLKMYKWKDSSGPHLASNVGNNNRA
jgi:hypothetical protein